MKGVGSSARQSMAKSLKMNATRINANANV